MQKPRVLAIATALDRFTVQDLTSVSGAAENTVRDILKKLRKDGAVGVSGKRQSKLLGRPSTEYAWTEAGRERCIAMLREAWPLGRPEEQPGSSVWAPADFEGLDRVDRDPFDAALTQATEFIQTLETGIAGEDRERLVSRAESEFRVLRNWATRRTDADVTLVSALEVRFDAAREDSHLDGLRNILISSQAELLKKIAGIFETTSSLIDGDQLEHGYGIVLDVSRRHNPASEQISLALAQISRQCFVLNFHSPAYSSATSNVLKELSAFLSTPLSAAARVFILIDHDVSSARRAEHIVGWFDQVANLREPVLGAYRRGRRVTDGLPVGDAAWLLGSRAISRSHDWLGHGLNKQRAMRLIVTAGTKHHESSTEARAARIALNEPMVIYSDPPAPETIGDRLRHFSHRTTKSGAEIKGLVIGSFPQETKLSPYICEDASEHFAEWDMDRESYLADMYDIDSDEPPIMGMLPAPGSYGR